MDALDLLLNRVSVTRLCDPAPDAAQLDLLFRAALRAPDHAQLRPWRFLTIAGPARDQLGERFDIRDFHAVVLENGAVPLDVLEELGDAYISRTRAG